jgi:hypothetical protein
MQALEVRADRPQPQTIEGIEYHVLKALPEKAYHFFKQKVRSATDKPKEEQEARSAFFLALRNSEILQCPTSSMLDQMRTIPRWSPKAPPWRT